jgi:hypothetical protein
MGSISWQAKRPLDSQEGYVSGEDTLRCYKSYGLQLPENLRNYNAQ